MGLGLLGHLIDFGGALADRDDEARCGGGVVGYLAGGFGLLRHGAVDDFEYRADRLDRLRDPVHRIDRARGIPLQRVDLLRNFLGRVLGLHRQRLDLGGDDREAASGGAGPRRLDGGVERQQRGLPGDLRDQIDDIADRGRGLPQAVDIEAGFAGGGAGLVGELAGVAHLRPDALRRMGELVRGQREGGGGGLRGAGAPGQGVGALADGGKRRRGGLGAAGDRIGRALELADHGAQFEFQQFEDFPGRIALRSDRAHRSQRQGRPRRASTTGAAGSGSRFRNKPNAMGFSRENDGTTKCDRILAFGHEIMVNGCLFTRAAATTGIPKTPVNL